MQLKLSDYAKKMQITYRAAWNRYKKGSIDAFADETGHVYVNVKDDKQGNRAVTYARVSSNDRKNSLSEQQARVDNFIKLNNLELVMSVKEIASGMNDNRPVLNKLLNKYNDWDVLVVENKDRLTRFGFNYIENLLNKLGKKIIVVNNNESDKEDLMKDLISVIYSFSARMYGLRRRKNKQEIIDFIEK